MKEPKQVIFQTKEIYNMKKSKSVLYTIKEPNHKLCDYCTHKNEELNKEIINFKLKCIHDSCEECFNLIDSLRYKTIRFCVHKIPKIYEIIEEHNYYDKSRRYKQLGFQKQNTKMKIKEFLVKH